MQPSADWYNETEKRLYYWGDMGLTSPICNKEGSIEGIEKFII